MGIPYNGHVDVCSIPGCDKRVYGHGLCQGHCRRLRLYGDPLAGALRRPKGLTTPEEVFSWFMPEDPPTSGCWDWVGPVFQGSGYGKIVISTGGHQRHWLAHRVSHEIFTGAIPEGLNALHSCDRPACAQPTHLEAGTQLKNLRDAADRRRMAAGERHHRTTLTEADVLTIRESALAVRELATQFGVSRQSIYDIRWGRRWIHV